MNAEPSLTGQSTGRRLRNRRWFDDPSDPGPWQGFVRDVVPPPRPPPPPVPPLEEPERDEPNEPDYKPPPIPPPPVLNRSWIRPGYP